MTQRQRIIPEFPGAGSLGRHVFHDERSKDYPAPRGAVQTVLHKRHTHPFDQGQLGSCTGNAMAGALDTDPLFLKGRYLYESKAVALYKLATKVDPWPGTYPPTDTGSDGLSVMKAAQQMGYIKSYTHAFGLQHALEALALSPVITGTNWYDSFDSPSSSGLVSITPGASVRGGHEYEVLGVDANAQTVRCANSWGTGWGDAGFFEMTWSTWETLLNQQGDVTVGQS